jgi:hypothetical protein
VQVVCVEVILKMVGDDYKWRQICSDLYSVQNNKNFTGDDTSVFQYSPEIK